MKINEIFYKIYKMKKKINNKTIFINKKHKSNFKLKKNQEINHSKIRLINVDGSQYGIVSINDGLSLAKENNLDLVEIVPNANPPVCRIVNFGKFIYEQTKKNKNVKNKQSKIKEIKFRMNIDQHDYETKFNKAKSFLSKGYKFKMTITMRGRELEHKDIGFNTANRLIKDLELFANNESSPKLVGKNIFTIFSPKKI